MDMGNKSHCFVKHSTRIVSLMFNNNVNREPQKIRSNE